MSGATTIAAWEEAMQKAGYFSMSAVAREVGVTTRTLIKWADGTMSPRHREDIDRVAAVLCVDAEKLFPGWVPASLRTVAARAKGPLLEMIVKAGYESIAPFAKKALDTSDSIADWASGKLPSRDEDAYRVAGLLDVAPTDIWPDWQPGRNWGMRTKIKAEEKAERQKARKSTRSYVRHGVIVFDDDAPGIHGMEEIRRKANVHVGQRLVMTYPTKDGAVRWPGSVVECAPYWFRVRYDAGWSECFHYQCRIDQTEGAYFRRERSR